MPRRYRHGHAHAGRGRPCEGSSDRLLPGLRGDAQHHRPQKCLDLATATATATARPKTKGRTHASFAALVGGWQRVRVTKRHASGEQVQQQRGPDKNVLHHHRGTKVPIVPPFLVGSLPFTVRHTAPFKCGTLRFRPLSRCRPLLVCLRPLRCFDLVATVYT